MLRVPECVPAPPPCLSSGGEEEDEEKERGREGLYWRESGRRPVPGPVRFVEALPVRVSKPSMSRC